MKTKSLLLAAAIVLIACQPTKQEPVEVETLFISAMEFSAPACAAPPPVNETVKFVPPDIKDEPLEQESNSNNKNVLSKNKKIIKDGSISIRVKDVEAAKKRIDAIVTSHEAYYENESFRNADYRVSYTLKVRVPAAKFESFLKASEKREGEIIHKDINARDVTEEFVDTETRLNSKKIFRNRYNQLLEKAGKVDDILAIEENIRVLQEEIESQEGQLKFLNDQVSYSTLEITLLSETAIVKPAEDSFFQRMKTSLGNGWDSLVSLVLWGIMQWPWILFILLVVVMVKVYWKKRRK